MGAYTNRSALVKRDQNGRIICGFEGVSIKDVYRNKPVLYKVLKRLIDIIVSVTGLILLLPLFLVIAIAIKSEDGGPVFFSGQRWGKDFKYFPMHKFRSMCVDAESRTSEVLSESDKNGMAFKIKDDPRITKVGSFLRQTTLDELPQLINVLKGEMSLVGPRPIQTTDGAGDPYELQRWCVKPGITCYWQVSGRANVPWDEWVELDLKYITEMSLLTDIKLIFKTFEAVLNRDGAN